MRRALHRWFYLVRMGNATVPVPPAWGRRPPLPAGSRSGDEAERRGWNRASRPPHQDASLVT